MYKKVQRILSGMLALLLVFTLMGPDLAASSQVFAAQNDDLPTQISAANSKDIINLTANQLINAPNRGGGNGDGPFLIDKELTIVGQVDQSGNPITTITSWPPIVLGADVTFENIKFVLSSGSIKGIFANGHKLTLKNCKVGNDFQQGFLFGGDYYYNGSAESSVATSVTSDKSGNASVITLIGNTQVSFIYAGSLNAIGNQTPIVQETNNYFPNGLPNTHSSHYIRKLKETNDRLHAIQPLTWEKPVQLVTQPDPNNNLKKPTIKGFYSGSAFRMNANDPPLRYGELELTPTAKAGKVEFLNQGMTDIGYLTLNAMDDALNQDQAVAGSPGEQTIFIMDDGNQNEVTLPPNLYKSGLKRTEIRQGKVTMPSLPPDELKLGLDVQVTITVNPELAAIGIGTRSLIGSSDAARPSKLLVPNKVSGGETKLVTNSFEGNIRLYTGDPKGLWMPANPSESLIIGHPYLTVHSTNNGMLTVLPSEDQPNVTLEATKNESGHFIWTAVEKEPDYTALTEAIAAADVDADAYDQTSQAWQAFTSAKEAAIILNRDQNAANQTEIDNVVSALASAQAALATVKYPAAPTGAAADSITKNTASISWTASADADSYLLKYDSKTKTASGTGTDLTGLSPDTAYTVEIYAVKGNLQSKTSAKVQFTTLAEVTLNKIQITTSPKTDYTENETFDPTGMKLTLTFSDGSSREVVYDQADSKFGFAPALNTKLTTQNKTVTVSYDGKEATLNINVTAQPVVTPVNKEALNTAIQTATEKQQAEYTSTSWTDFAAALETAKNVAKNQAADQNAVDQALAALNTASNKLVLLQFTALDQAIQSAPAEQESDKYTPESWQNLQTKLAEAKAVRANPHGDQAKIDAAATNLQAAITGLQSAVPSDQEIAQRVIEQIENLPAADQIKLENEPAVKAAEKALSELTPAQQLLVSNKNKLTDVRTALDTLKKHDADQKAATDAIAKIDAIQTVTLSSGAKITLARTAYDALSTEAKAMVGEEKLAVLTAAEARLEELQAAADKEAADTAAANGVIEQINNLGVISLNSKQAIEATRTAYENLNPEAKAKVSNLDTLIAAEARLEELQAAADKEAADTAAANGVIEQINNLGIISLNSKQAIEAARTAYESLNPEAKAKVSNLNTLIAAEARLEELQAAADKEAADTAAANGVIEQINNLGIISLNSKQAIEAARTAYENLNPEAKAKVSNLNTLIAAEARLEELQAAAKPTSPSAPAPTSPPTTQPTSPSSPAPTSPSTTRPTEVPDSVEEPKFTVTVSTEKIRNQISSDLPENLSETAQKAAAELLEQIENMENEDAGNAVESATLTSAAEKALAAAPVEKDTARQAIQQLNPTAQQLREMHVIAQPYIEISVKAVQEQQSKINSFTVSLTPMMRTLATFAKEEKDIQTEGSRANAVQIGEPSHLEVTESLSVNIPLPADFSKKENSVFVEHKGYVYIGQVIQINGQEVVSFENPHGFSDFTVYAESPATAQIGQMGYMSLEKALAEADSGTAIQLLKPANDNLVVDRAIDFTLEGQPFTGSITAGKGLEVTNSGNHYIVTAKTAEVEKECVAPAEPEETEHNSGWIIWALLAVVLAILVGMAIWLFKSRKK